MDQVKDFYPELHAAEASYGAGTYHLKSLFQSRAMKNWLEGLPASGARIADIGIGKGLFLRDLVRFVESRGLKIQKVTGLDLVRSPGDHFSELAAPFEFIEQNLDGKPLPLAEASVDFLCCNHVLEHIFETEKLVREFRRVVARNGMCVISVPNLAAWINRAALLFGGQPLGTELGTEKTTYGFWPTALQPRLERFRPSGHIRDFTPRALRDLAFYCGFETVGWWPQSNGLVARLGKWAGRNIGIILRPR